MPFKERNVHKMVEKVETISWRLRECIRVMELAAAHRLERMSRLRMLEKQKVWKLEAGFDRIDITAEMDAQRFRTGFDSEPFYTKLYNRRWSQTPEEHTLEMRVDVERLMMKIVLSQPAPPPQCDSSPRRSPTVGTGLNEPRTPHAESQSTVREGIFLLKPASMVFCTSVAQVRNTKLLLCFRQTTGWTASK